MFNAVRRSAQLVAVAAAGVLVGMKVQQYHTASGVDIQTIHPTRATAYGQQV